MLEKILHSSIRNRWFVMGAILCVAALGVYNFQRLPIDAVPDITNVQVQINTEAIGYSPLEVERRITFPIETALTGVPGTEYTRSISRYGLSQVTVVFKDGTNIYFARQLLIERLQEVKDMLPPGLSPTMGPISTGLGEIYMWTVEADSNTRKEDGTPYSLSDLRTIQDWIVKPQLKTIEGVAEVNTIGGYEKQFHITPSPEKLQAYGISFREVFEAIEKNNSNIGAGYIEHNGQQYLIRVPGQATGTEDIGNIFIDVKDGTALRIKDVAEIGEGKELRTGAATENGKEVVLGTVFMLIGENSGIVSKRVDDKMEEINRSLPAGVTARTVYDRTNLVDATIATVERNLVEGALLVIVILFLFLGNIRAAILTALVIPLSMLFTITGMVSTKVSGNLLSLGALDFGIIVDGAVIIVENCIRRLAEEQHKLGRLLSMKERFEIVFQASKEVRKATMFGEAIIMIVYLPILTLTGIEGKMFYPMAITVIIALASAMVLSVTFVPAAVAILLRGKISEKEIFIVKWAKQVYSPVLDFSLKNKAFILIGAGFLVVSSIFIASRMGSEFLPVLDEGDIAIHGLRIPGTSLTQAIAMQDAMEKKLMELPEVDKVFSKIGTAEIATDPMPPSVADVFVIMKPRDQWRDPSMPKDEMVKKMEKALEAVPGSKYQFLQPIQMRFNELISGIRSDVGIKVFGDDMDKMKETAEQIAASITTIQGAADVEIEQVTGLPMLTIKLNKYALSRYGMSVADVQEVIEIAVGGKKAGQIFEGDRKFDIVVRMPEALRQDIESIRNIPIPLPNQVQASIGGGGGSVPLRAVADIDLASGPNQISRESGKRLVVVTANVRDRDLGSFIEEAQQKVIKEVTLPAGYWIEWGGQFQQLISAAKRLQIIVPIALLLVILLLYMSFKSVKDALLIFSGVPLAVTGGIIALWLRDIPLSISAGVGFIALSGMAVLNGLVMVSFIRQKRSEGASIDSAINEGALTRLRPVLMTALVASFGFVPMALATSIGAEVQRPLATVVIGGIISSTVLTLVVLPVLYRLFHKNEQ